MLSVIIGILFLRHTDETLTSLAFLIGLFWVVGGMIEFFTAYGDRGSDARWFRVVMGILAIAAGIVTLVWPGITLLALAVVIGVWLAIYGLLEIAVSFQLRRLAKVAVRPTAPHGATPGRRPRSSTRLGLAELGRDLGDGLALVRLDRAAGRRPDRAKARGTARAG